MGFPSPANDYVEQRLTVASLCRFDANCRVIETSAGYAVVDVSRRARQGDHVLISCSRNVQFAIVRGRSLITIEGEAIEGEALDDVVVEGVVTFLINRAYHHDDDQIPVI
ncbi:hypothetical protein [Klebsiella pneumoniae]|uniref:hypothetical protein n=1 Tax=Klebsiella pneumoniae TaxID=573 RepID=UPI0024B6E0EB|nr:hypothetical protein [Klebsiella pneumoniae]WHP24706.1 hypothetical protein QMW18_15760 [Klebsiella pneumoniae]HBR5057428.1 hypothetical protein [Klebsiella pneumoniae]